MEPQYARAMASYFEHGTSHCLSENYIYVYISADPKQLQGERVREKVSLRLAAAA
jgi:hypothetical protein